MSNHTRYLVMFVLCLTASRFLTACATAPVSPTVTLTRPTMTVRSPSAAPSETLTATLRPTTTRTASPIPPTSTTTPIPPTLEPTAILERVVSEKIVVEINLKTLMFPESLSVSPDMRHVAYVDQLGNGLAVVVDGKAGKIYDGIGNGSLQFSPNGRRVAYAAIQGDQWLVVVDGRESKSYDFVGNIAFSPDSQLIAYLAGTGDTLRIVVDGNVGELIPVEICEVSGIFFSPNGRRIAYILRQGVCGLTTKDQVVVDGQASALFDSVIDLTFNKVSFSPDSKHIAYVASVQTEEALKVQVVLDGEGGTLYDKIHSLTFSPDSQHFAYIAQEGNQIRVVVDGEEDLAKYSIIEDTLIFSPESQHLAYIALAGDQRVVIIDGKEGKSYPSIGASTLLFSPDSQRVGYIAGEKDKWFVVVGGIEGRRYDMVDSLTFDPDNQRVAYGAQTDEGWVVIVDGTEGKSYDNIFTIGGGVDFDAHDKLHYLAIQGNNIISVEETISSTREKTPTRTSTSTRTPNATQTKQARANIMKSMYATATKQAQLARATEIANYEDISASDWIANPYRYKDRKIKIKGIASHIDNQETHTYFALWADRSDKFIFVIFYPAVDDIHEGDLVTVYGVGNVFCDTDGCDPAIQGDFYEK